VITIPLEKGCHILDAPDFTGEAGPKCLASFILKERFRSRTFETGDWD